MDEVLYFLVCLLGTLGTIGFIAALIKPPETKFRKGKPFSRKALLLCLVIFLGSVGVILKWTEPGHLEQARIESQQELQRAQEQAELNRHEDVLKEQPEVKATTIPEQAQNNSSSSTQDKKTNPPAPRPTHKSPSHTSKPRTMIKKNRRGLCLTENYDAYDSTQRYTAFRTLRDCLKSGGSLPHF